MANTGQVLSASSSTITSVASKYDKVNLEVLAALFRRVDPVPFEQDLAAFIPSRPTGQYARRLWFLYELLTARRLEIDDVTTGNYVALLDEADYFRGRAREERRDYYRRAGEGALRRPRHPRRRALLT